jgi:hypothetical protein
VLTSGKPNENATRKTAVPTLKSWQMFSPYQTRGILSTTEMTLMDDKEKYTDTATLRVAQRNISEPEYNIF